LNQAQSPDVLESSTGDLVDMMLYGLLSVQIDTEVPSLLQFQLQSSNNGLVKTIGF